MPASNTQLARKAVNQVLSFFSGGDEDVNVNGLNKRNRERMVRAVARVLNENPAMVVSLTIRDPDYPNDHITDVTGNVTIENIDMDLGSSFNGPKDFDPESDWGREWLENMRSEVAHLPPTSDVRRAVENVCNELEG